jgi:hypothetical protein
MAAPNAFSLGRCSRAAAADLALPRRGWTAFCIGARRSAIGVRRPAGGSNPLGTPACGSRRVRTRSLNSRLANWRRTAAPARGLEINFANAFQNELRPVPFPDVRTSVGRSNSAGAAVSNLIFERMKRSSA